MEFRPVSDFFEEGLIPLQLRGHMAEDCPDCGFFMVMNDNMTQRRCGDYECIGHLAEKADRMMKYLKIEGIGPAKSRSLMTSNNLTSHFDILPLIIKYKPSVHLFEIAILLQIDGEKGKLEKELKPYSSFLQYFSRGKTYPALRGYEEELMRAESYFDIKPPITGATIEIMITGSLAGYTKNAFIDLCNEIMGGYVHIKMVGLKNTAQFCITENKSSSTDKARLARGELRSGVSIPMYSSKELLNALVKSRQDIDSQKESERLLEDEMGN